MDNVVELADTIAASVGDPTLEEGEEDGDRRETVRMEAREEDSREVSFLVAATHGKVTTEVEEATTTVSEDMATPVGILEVDMAGDIILLAVNSMGEWIGLINSSEAVNELQASTFQALDTVHHNCCLPGRQVTQRLPASPNAVPGDTEGADGG